MGSIRKTLRAAEDRCVARKCRGERRKDCEEMASGGIRAAVDRAYNDHGEGSGTGRRVAPSAIWGIWDEERTAKLMRLFEEGHSASEIGLRMGLTRNQVIGKLHRLGHSKPRPQRNPADIQTAKLQRKRERKARIPVLRMVTNGSGLTWVESSKTKLRAVRLAAVEPRHLTLLERDDATDCRYPYGDGPFTYCGHQRRDGSSYCPAHHALVWTSPERRTT